MDRPIIQAIDIAKRFNPQEHNEVVAVNTVNLSIAENSCVVIKGPSGSGKTTLLTIISCLAKPTSGEYYCLNNKVSRWSEKFLTSFRQQHIGVIFQEFGLINGFTAEWNIATPLYPRNISAREIRNRVHEVAEIVNISHRLNFKVEKLSGGEKQRVAIARALISKPEILFADEPTAHLDSEMALSVLDIFKELKSNGKTIIFATHDPLVENHEMVDEVYIMKDGRLNIERSSISLSTR